MNELHLALAGNPNSGKTSTFNILTGATQHVGNWPGVTVERKSGQLKKSAHVMIQDLPGIYSLSPYTPEEIVARDYLLEGHPDAILNVVDAANLERNLYLTTQLLETGIPVVLALNMMDILRKSGKRINLEKLAYGLGVPCVGMSALKKEGIDELVLKGTQAAEKFPPQISYPVYDDHLEAALAEITDVLGNTVPERQARFYAVKLFERDQLVSEKVDLSAIQKRELNEIITITEKLYDDTSDAIIINARYEFIARLMKLCTVDEEELKISWTDRIDEIVTNRFLALPIFAGVMWLIYYISIQTIGDMGTSWVNDVLFGELVPNVVSQALASWQVAAWMQSLILEGIIAGVGAVLGFLPQIAVLFFCLAILEDCGYMSRIAFVMDRMFRKFGLSGKSFIPMLIATGCGVPGVMASRTIENEKDRRMTAMITTFMPCSAKLPIIALVAGAFFPHASWVAPSAYFVGITAIVLSGVALKKTKLFAGDPAPFIMELPAYHLPQATNVLRYTLDRTLAFAKKAGTIIFVSCILIWFTGSYNFQLQAVSADESILAAFGRLIAPLFVPLGWGNWQGAVGTITGLIAKENVIGTFGVLYAHLEEVSENGAEFWTAMQGDFTAVAAYSFLLFNLLCAPCFAAIGAIHREMANTKWTWIAVGYQCGLAYAVSMVVYQFGHIFFEGGSINLFTVLAGLLLAGMIYMIVKKPKEPTVAVINLNLAKEGGK